MWLEAERTVQLTDLEQRAHQRLLREFVQEHLGEDRPLWQIILGSILAALAVLTRQNMAPVLPLLVLYIFWQHGKSDVLIWQRGSLQQAGNANWDIAVF